MKMYVGVYSAATAQINLSHSSRLDVENKVVVAKFRATHRGRAWEALTNELCKYVAVDEYRVSIYGTDGAGTRLTVNTCALVEMKAAQNGQ